MQQWASSSLPGPPGRDDAALALHAPSNTLYMFGGVDKGGAPTATLFALSLPQPGSHGGGGSGSGGASCATAGWRQLDCRGALPPPRWGATALATAGALWVYGGCAGAASKGPLTELHCLDLSSLTWTTAAQAGCAPDRRWASSRQATFGRAAATPDGSTLLAFGRAQQDDENADPSSPAALQLHAFSVASGAWQQLSTAGAISFSHLAALAVAGEQLLATGWSPLPPGSKGDCKMQVCSLDLRSCLAAQATPPASRARLSPFAISRCGTPPAWTLLPARGVVPTARVGAAAAVTAGSRQLLLHGGMLVSHSVQGRLTADSCCFDIASGTWTQLQALTGAAEPRVSHAAVWVPGLSAIVLLGGTTSRANHASCTAMQVLRLVNPSADTAAAAATAAADGVAVKRARQQPKPLPACAPPPPAAAPPAAPEACNLSSTPAFISIQPFAQLYATPPLAASSAAAAAMAAVAAVAAPTPVVHVTPPGAAAASQLAALQPDAGALPPAALTPTYDFSAFCCSDVLADVELLAGDAAFPAHKLLLCQSPRLAQLLRTASDPSQLVLQDVYPDVLQLMLRYLYGCLAAIPVEASPLLFTAASSYVLPQLRAACLAVLISSLGIDNVTSYALLAHQHSCGELMQACVSYAAATFERFQQVLASAGFNDLNRSHPAVGALFVRLVLQCMGAQP